MSHKLVLVGREACAEKVVDDVIAKRTAGDSILLDHGIGSLMRDAALGGFDAGVRAALIVTGQANAETQESISQWAEATFGPASSNARVAARANEEMAELLRVLTANDDAEHAVVEAADVVIVLFRLAARMGYDLLGVVDEKMTTNRRRVWRQDGSGHGYHVRDRTVEPESVP